MITGRPMPWAGHEFFARTSPEHGHEIGVPTAPLPPSLRRLLMVLTLFNGASAIGGSIALLVWRRGNDFLPIELVEHTPFKSFLVPGLLLAVVVGGSSFACAVLAWRRSRAALDATILAGGALTVWIVVETATMRGFHWLHALYGALGVGILGLGIHAGWRSPARRHRWVIVVTLAETMGYLVPACTGILTTRAGVDGVTQAGWIVAAGLVEGFILGAGQARAFPLRLRRTRYALLTAIGAGVVWASVMFLTLAVKSATVSAGLAVAAGVLTAVVGLASIGSFQWIELRHRTERAHRWIAWTALAWMAALPFSFAPGPFVDELTPLTSHLLLWGSGGLLMAYVMALVTWQGAQRLDRASTL